MAVLFGPLGFIVGPIVAALFVTVWELYGAAFADLLPPAPPAPASVAEFTSTYPPPPVEKRRGSSSDSEPPSSEGASDGPPSTVPPSLRRNRPK